MSKSLNELANTIIKFRDSRDWKKYHNPKDMAISLVLESNEFLELFQWKDKKETDEFIKNLKTEISDEIADILYWVLLISHDLNIDVQKALETKMVKNEKKYPIEKSKGNHKKYTEL